MKIDESGNYIDYHKVIPNTMQEKILSSKTMNVKSSISKLVSSRVALFIYVKLKIHQ